MKTLTPVSLPTGNKIAVDKEELYPKQGAVIYSIESGRIFPLMADQTNAYSDFVVVQFQTALPGTPGHIENVPFVRMEDYLRLCGEQRYEVRFENKILWVNDRCAVNDIEGKKAIFFEKQDAEAYCSFLNRPVRDVEREAEEKYPGPSDLPPHAANDRVAREKWAINHAIETAKRVGFIAGASTGGWSDEERIAILGLNDPWPLKDVLQRLIFASQVLLHDKGYDGHGYEEIEIAKKRSFEIIESVNNIQRTPLFSFSTNGVDKEGYTVIKWRE